ncbi:cysteine desulfurase / selenocysteine lyase [Tistlia consotensis]|uniref:Cysteine desulfurase n=1 Tax=Tistlia consotensis USBA 355 TaxID=560819 RepID=A0A1Y6CER0_9PROT|nr:aminotransferase class V-fold PLP-dependent enzyme [Tistlia consotensis]SMF48556.1 cysteine desulfurase / selenocysteine lyase [Tistlia consotensis USBA 355]SNR81044.1 cysteine desulfurase / selenocysteine lyase [Tistlia consotensis]
MDQAFPSDFDPRVARRQFPGLAEPGLHYLDNAATAQVPEAVLDALRRFEVEARGNVHGTPHRRSLAAQAAYDAARAAVAAYLNVAPREVVFTYGATSAINLVADSLADRLGPADRVVVSWLEHHSNLLPWQKLARRRGVRLGALPVTAEGRLDLARLGEVVRPDTRLVAVTHCSNVTGAETDVAAVVEAARAVGALVLLDGAQRAPHGPLDLPGLGADLYAFSGHKTYGPTGIGVLWGRSEVLDWLPPFMVGGQMIRSVTMDEASFADPPRRFEAGTPPIAGAVGLGAAADWALGLDWPAIRAHERRLTARAIAGLRALPGVRLLGPLDLERRGPVVSFVAEGVDSLGLCRRLDRDGFALRSGHHCAQPLHAVLGASSSARASFALYNEESEVDGLLLAVERALVELRA